MTNRIFSLIILILTGSCSLMAQQVQLQSLSLAGKEAKLYYFTGAKADSILSVVDTSGKAVFEIPDKDYRGMATLVITSAEGIEIIVTEPFVLVECDSGQLKITNVSFPDSKENNF